MERKFVKSLEYSSLDEIVFGFSKHPVICGYNVTIGKNKVLPEVNFTLPPMSINEETFSTIRREFQDIVRNVLKRAVQLQQEELVLEFEHLYELTKNPKWGAIITSDIKKIMEEFKDKYGLKSALRVTVADIREQERPPRMRSGELFQTMLTSFEECAKEGADILSIESTGGKELSDRALLEGDIEGVIFSLGVLAPRDMEFLWKHIVDISKRYNVVPGGDTACGFANTAMQLAHQEMLPKVFAAVVRLASVPRSLVAVEMGAIGPLKDCGYENPIIKMLSGVPISMEGKSSACAHSSPLGNIASAVCDLWSNESVQNVRLLGGFAPEVFTEILIYDCRLMNVALENGFAYNLRDLFVKSDVNLDPQALVMDLNIGYKCAKKIIEVGESDYERTKALSHIAIEEIKNALNSGKLKLSPQEIRWLNILEGSLENLPKDYGELYERVEAKYKGLFIPEEYGL